MSSIAKICKESDCDRPLCARGLCKFHYQSLRKEVGLDAMSGPRKRAHPMARTPEYKAWCDMKRRCSDLKFEAYNRYGGRGIKVCDLWCNSFDAFYEDMGSRPSKGYSVDRKNNDGHYSCGHCSECWANGWTANCRWATRNQQAINKRFLYSNNKSGYRGVHKNRNGKMWKATIGYSGKVVPLGTYKTLQEAADAYDKAAMHYYGKDAKLNNLATQKLHHFLFN